MPVTERSFAELATDVVVSRSMPSQVIMLLDGEDIKYLTPLKTQAIVALEIKPVASGVESDCGKDCKG
jgi:hypothetical protein